MAADPGGGFASRVSGHIRPWDPGGGTVSTVSPRRMTIDDFCQAVEQSGGGGAQLVPSGVSIVWTEKTLAEDTPGRECPQDDVGLRLREGTMWMLKDRVPSMNIESPYGGGVSFPPRCYWKSSSGEVSSCACTAC